MLLRPRIERLALLLVVTLAGFSTHRLCAVELFGYQTHDQFERSIAELSSEQRVSLTSVGTTGEGRDVHLLTLSTGEAASKPAVLLMGSVDASNLVGSELAVRMATQWAKALADDDPDAKKLLEAVTLYVIPRPSPDASAHVFDTPISGRATNTRQTDADRDAALDEDPHEDLDGNGVITSVRVADPAGEWIKHPDDPRVLVRADASKNETGQYRLFTEGVDNDQDESFNEDGAGGVDFNRNFPFEYPYFAGDAGPHQVSEPETRAVADWLFTQPNIFLVFSFAPQDNLTKPWPIAKDNGGRIKRQVLKEDGPFFQFLADMYGKQVAKENAPSAASVDGAFAPWGYYHFGRWSIATHGWWIPKVETKSDDATEEASEDETEASADADKAEGGETSDNSQGDGDSQDKPNAEESKKDESGKTKSERDDRGAADSNALAWFANHDIDGFAEWTEVEHPDFPGKKVEIGGFKPLVREHPPADELDELAKKHREFLSNVVELRARLEFEAPEVESLGAGVYRVTVAVLNRGFLPTASAMGRAAKKLQRLELQIVLPEGGQVLTGHVREDLGVIDGNGGRAEHTWLIRLPNSEPTEVTVRAGEPSIGTCEQILQLKSAEMNHEENNDDN
jgi:hypothetical protein